MIHNTSNAQIFRLDAAGTQPVVVETSDGDNAFGVGTQPSGKVLALVGEQSGAAAKVLRLNADLSTDTTFGQGGAIDVSSTAFFTGPESLLVNSDGSFYVAQTVSNDAETTAANPRMDIALLGQWATRFIVRVRRARGHFAADLEPQHGRPFAA